MYPTESAKTANKVAALRRTDLFGSLRPDLLTTVAHFAASRHLSRGQVLFSETEEASGLFVVAEGELRSIRQSMEGREQVLSTELPGSVLAVAPVFVGGTYYSTVIADTKSQVLVIGKEYAHRLCREHAELLWNVVRVLAHRVRRSADLIETLALRNVEQRVAEHVLNIASERGVTVGQGCLVELTLTRTEVAARIGSTREVVSRAFTHLQENGLIQMQGRRLVMVPNMRLLRSFAGIERTPEQGHPVSDLSSDLA
jgi:CRP-like cAMP-binding protein